MESLYVCLFSNGHIKVGRSIDPKSRMASHADRVACMGVELSDQFSIECAGAAGPSESELIERCAEAATRRFQSEWFAGLDFLDVCEWAKQCASAEHSAVEVSPLRAYLDSLPTGGARLFAEQLGFSHGYLYQLSTGTRRASVIRAVEIEQATGGKVTRADLRSDWPLIWPEFGQEA